MCQLCLIYFYFFNIYICTKTYHGMHKYQQVNFFSNIVKSTRSTYGSKEELAPLMMNNRIYSASVLQHLGWVSNYTKATVLHLKPLFYLA